MSTTPRPSTLSDMEELVVAFQGHSLALELLVIENRGGWNNVKTQLLFSRLDALRSSVEELEAMWKALWEEWAAGDPGETVTTAAASDRHGG